MYVQPISGFQALGICRSIAAIFNARLTSAVYRVSVQLKVGSLPSLGLRIYFLRCFLEVLEQRWTKPSLKIVFF
jgi:hypothetical protein